MCKFKFLIIVFIITGFLLVTNTHAKERYKCPFNKIENINYYKPVEIEVIRDGNNFARLKNIGTEPINLTTLEIFPYDHTNNRVLYDFPFPKESLNRTLLPNEHEDICLMFPEFYIVYSTEGEVASFLVTKEKGLSPEEGSLPFFIWPIIVTLFIVFFIIFKKIRKSRP